MNETAKHTPGPWKITNRLMIVDGNGEFIADAAQVSFTDTGEDVLSTSEPNARLIAAAPDLLAALKALKYHADKRTFPGDEYLDEIDALIARASSKAS